MNRLPGDALEALVPHLRAVQLAHGKVLFNSDDDILSVYFPHPGTMVSFVTTLVEGQTIESGMVGYTGMVGSSALVNGGQALSTAMIQIAGSLSVISVEHMQDAVHRDPTLRAKIGGHEQFMYVQAQQAAACNACHPIERGRKSGRSWRPCKVVTVRPAMDRNSGKWN